MLIPANEYIARKLDALPIHFKHTILRELLFFAEHHCQDDLIAYDVKIDEDIEVMFGIPSKSLDNGIRKLFTVMNTVWTYDPGDIKQKVLSIISLPRGNFLHLRKGPKTTDLHQDNSPIAWECQWDSKTH
ncbi:MAG: hypothetical protein KDD13_00365 [Mangrovimonas sp.]|nr:hypothetical protein [Mangrovimonas sp.]